MKDPLDTIRHTRIGVRRTGHIYHYGNSGAPTLWLACHGYGQLAKHFIRKFDILDKDQHWVIAPEGLSRFYWEGVDGNPAASWMTKEDRLDEIADYVGFLDEVYDRYIHSARPERFFLFGFSQGCATLWRWILNRFPEFDAFILWAGWLPEDMLYARHQEYLKDKRILYVAGDRDEYYTREREDVLKLRFQEAGLSPEYLKYAGNHAVDRAFLQQLFTDHLV